MKKFSATITINASPETIWTILTDAAGYPEWDPNADRIEGTIALGEQIKAFTKLSPGRAFPVIVTEFDPPKKMTWVGGMPMGLFKGERVFTLEPTGDGAVKFTVREVFSGLLLPIFGRTVPDLDPVFAEFAAGLKSRAEKGG